MATLADADALLHAAISDALAVTETPGNTTTVRWLLPHLKEGDS